MSLQIQKSMNNSDEIYYTQNVVFDENGHFGTGPTGPQGDRGERGV